MSCGDAYFSPDMRPEFGAGTLPRPLNSPLLFFCVFLFVFASVQMDRPSESFLNSNNEGYAPRQRLLHSQQSSRLA